MAKVIKGTEQQVVCTDEKLLKRVSQNPVLGSDDCIRTANALLKAYEALDCKVQGLAGIQVWEPIRVILVRYKKDTEPEVCVSPVVLDKFGSKTSMEGCESEPGKHYWVKRPVLAKIAYYKLDGLYIEKWITYKKARIFCHEVDHLDGILLKDKGVRVPDAYISGLSKS